MKVVWTAEIGRHQENEYMCQMQGPVPHLKACGCHNMENEQCPRVQTYWLGLGVWRLFSWTAFPKRHSLQAKYGLSWEWSSLSLCTHGCIVVYLGNRGVWKSKRLVGLDPNKRMYVMCLVQELGHLGWGDPSWVDSMNFSGMSQFLKLIPLARYGMKCW